MHRAQKLTEEIRRLIGDSNISKYEWSFSKITGSYASEFHGHLTCTSLFTAWKITRSIMLITRRKLRLIWKMTKINLRGGANIPIGNCRMHKINYHLEIDKCLKISTETSHEEHGVWRPRLYSIRNRKNLSCLAKLLNLAEGSFLFPFFNVFY